MFEVGDKVIVTNNKYMNGAFKINDVFTVEYTENSTPSQRIVLLEKGSFYYDSNFFELDKLYYRKEKILKIKKRINYEIKRS